MLAFLSDSESEYRPPPVSWLFPGGGSLLCWGGVGHDWGMSNAIGEPRVLRLDDLVEWGRNPRQGDVEAIKESLKTNGQFRPVVVNQRGGRFEVLAGNHTVRAMRELGWETVQAHVLNVGEDAARRIMLADNRTSDLAGYDLRALAEELAELDGLEGTAYDTADLEALADMEDVLPAEEFEGEYPYPGTATITLHLMPPLREQWDLFVSQFESPEEGLEFLLDHAV